MKILEYYAGKYDNKTIRLQDGKRLTFAQLCVTTRKLLQEDATKSPV